MSKHISLRVSESQLEDWDDFHDREDTSVRSRTELIQEAVSTYISKGGQTEEGELALNVAVEELRDGMSQLGQEMGGVQEELRAIKRQTAGTDTDVKELAHDVLALLPPAKEDRGPREYDEYQKPLGEYEPAEVDIPVTEDAILAWLRADPKVDPGYVVTIGDVEEALEFLEDQYLARSKEIGGETRWAKEV